MLIINCIMSSSNCNFYLPSGLLDDVESEYFLPSDLFEDRMLSLRASAPSFIPVSRNLRPNAEEFVPRGYYIYVPDPVYIPGYGIRINTVRMFVPY